jgi:O-antigen ligase
MRSGSAFDKLLERLVGGLLLFSVAWLTFWFAGVNARQAWPAFAAIGAAGALWMLRTWVESSHRFLLPPVTWAIAAFFGYAAWRCHDARVPYWALQEVFLIGICAMAFFISLHNLHRQETSGWVVGGLLAVGLLASAYAIVQFTQNSQRILWETQPLVYYKRYGATFVNPNHLAAFLLMLMPLALANAFLGRGNAVQRIVAGYAALMMMGGIAVTMSRGGWLGAAVAVATFSLWLLRRPQYRIPMAVLVALLCLGAVTFLSKSEKARARIDALTVSGKKDSGLFRAWIWKPALRMWSDHRWAGVGPGQFDSRFPAYRTPTTPLSPQHVHNEYLELLVEYGVAGAGIVGFGLVAFGYGLYRTSKHVERGSSDLGVKQSNRTAFFAGSVAGLAGLGVHCFFDFNLHIPAIAVTASVLLGILVSNTRFATERFWIKSHIPLRLAATGAMGGMLYWMIPLGAVAAREDLHLKRAELRPAVDEQFFEELARAASLAPGNPMTPYWYGEEKRRQSWQGLPGWEKHAQEALRWLENSAKLDPFNARTVVSMGLCHQWLGDLPAASARFEAALELGPNDVAVLNALAWNLIVRGESDRARALVERSLAINPWDNWEARSYAERLRSTRP